MKAFYILLLLSFCCFHLSYEQPQKPSGNTYSLVFETKVGGSFFDFDSTYQNHSGESFTVHNFRFYISHIQLQYADKKLFSLPTNPHLINESDSVSKTLSFTAPAGEITNLSFLLGIDSITNVSGVQTGDLDPAKGMFWIWNTGYIMAKLEGQSPSSKAPAKQYSYDIGGFKTGENVTRQINLSIPKVAHHSSSTFIITADIGKWFYGKNNIRISDQPMCHSPGMLAMQVADNYADMFSIQVQ